MLNLKNVQNSKSFVGNPRHFFLISALLRSFIIYRKISIIRQWHPYLYCWCFWLIDQRKLHLYFSLSIATDRTTDRQNFTMLYLYCCWKVFFCLRKMFFCTALIFLTKHLLCSILRIVAVNVLISVITPNVFQVSRDVFKLI